MIRQSPLVFAVHANCLRGANLLFMVYGTRDIQHSSRTAATKRQQAYDSPISTHVRCPCELLASCEFVEGTHLGHQNCQRN